MGRLFTMLSPFNFLYTCDGEHHVGACQCLYHPVPFLEHHPPGQENSWFRRRMRHLPRSSLFWVQALSVPLPILFQDTFWFSAASRVRVVRNFFPIHGARFLVYPWNGKMRRMSLLPTDGWYWSVTLSDFPSEYTSWTCLPFLHRLRYYFRKIRYNPERNPDCLCSFRCSSLLYDLGSDSGTCRRSLLVWTLVREWCRYALQTVVFVIYAFLLTAGVCYGIIFTYRTKDSPEYYTLVSFSLIIGYPPMPWPWFVLWPIHQWTRTIPDNVFNPSFLSENRDQYGSRPLGYGQYYNARSTARIPILQGSPPMSRRMAIMWYRPSTNRFPTTMTSLVPYSPVCTVPMPNISRNTRTGPISRVTGKDNQQTRENLRLWMKPTSGRIFNSSSLTRSGTCTEILYVEFLRTSEWYSPSGRDSKWKLDLRALIFLDSIRLGDQNHLPPTLGETGQRMPITCFLLSGIARNVFPIQFREEGKTGFFSVVCCCLSWQELPLWFIWTRNPLPAPRAGLMAYAGHFMPSLSGRIGVLGCLWHPETISPAK